MGNFGAVAALINGAGRERWMAFDMGSFAQDVPLHHSKASEEIPSQHVQNVHLL